MGGAWVKGLTGWARGAFLTACALLCAPPAAAQNAAAQTVGVRLGGDMTATRVVIDSPGALTGRLATASAGEIVIALLGVAPTTEADGGGLALVKTWRLETTPSGARLILNVKADSVVRRRFVIPPGEGGGAYRYVIDIGPPAPATASQTASTQPVAASTPIAAGSTPVAVERSRAVETVRVAARRTKKVIVIDAGHGGHDPGAQSADASEKDITLAAALSLRSRLERTGHYKVVMTRSTDVFIPLDARVQIARRAGADLFIALHADSAGTDSGPHGASVYTLSEHGETRVGEVLGHDEWFTHTGAKSDPGVGRILLDLTQRSTKNRSAIFAGLLVARLSDKIDLLPRSHRDAGYFVLLAPDVPAVLLEMGFISSPTDEARLTDPSQRGELMDAVAQAIDAYFAGQTELAER